MILEDQPQFLKLSGWMSHHLGPAIDVASSMLLKELIRYGQKLFTSLRGNKRLSVSMACTRSILRHAVSFELGKFGP